MQEIKMNGESLNIEQENIEKLKEIFPEVFNEDKIDFEKLQNVLGNYIDTDEEKYRFTWNGKMDALRLSQTPSTGTLRPCKEESRDWDTTQNLYIEGDNLEVLKLLQNSYLNKINVIYIDPPYNKGKDFVYKDDFKDNITNYKKMTGQIDSDGNTLSTNSETSGRYHTNWLNMMYPRLRLARNLLTADGVIFISIDDKEVDNLRKVCDEIFGDGNFQVIFPRVTKKGGKSSDVTCKNHDYILMYCKNSFDANLIGVSHIDEGYCNKDEYFDERGYYKSNQTLDYDSLGYVKSLDYPIVINNETFYAGGDEETYRKRQKGEHGRADWGWRWSKSLFDFGYKNGFIEIKRGGKRPRIYTKTYEKVTIENENGQYFIKKIDRTKPLSTLEFIENKFSNDNATKIIDDLIGKGVFEYTKPPELILQLTKLFNSKDIIILDFFSGSATTAHAMMQLNSDDKGTRKYICVQLPEKVEQTSEAYKFLSKIDKPKNICEIGKERIRRAGDKIKKEIEQENQQLKLGEEPKKLPDIGFKVFKLDSSNIRKWNPDTKDLERALLDQVDNFVEGRKEEDALYEIILKNGLPLTVPVEELSIKGKKVYSIGMGAMIVCLDNNITLDVADEIATISTEFEDKSMVTVVFKDNGFENDSVKTNIKETLRGYDIGKFVTV